jgi:hypothetical protein
MKRGRPKNNPLSLIDTYVGVQNLTSLNAMSLSVLSINSHSADKKVSGPPHETEVDTRHSIVRLRRPQGTC